MENYLKEELYSYIKSDDMIFDFLQNATLDGLWFWDLENPENEWMNEKFWEVLGYDPSTKKHLSSQWQDIIFQDDLKIAIDNFNKHLKDPKYPYDQTVRYIHKNGHTIWIRCRGLALRDKEGTPTRMLGAHNDITQIKMHEDELEKANLSLEEKTKEFKELNDTLEEKVMHQTLTLYQRLYYDNLTKLPNRKKLLEDINTLDPIGILILNIKDFKDVNSVYGHTVGNLVLIELARTLLNIALERNCNLYHIGADEFVLLNLRNDIKSYCYGTANSIIYAIEKEGLVVEHDNKPLKILLTLNIGMARTKENLLNNAQLALKYSSKNYLSFYKYDKDDNLEKDSSNNIEVANLIKKAIDKDNIVPFFQPIYNKKNQIIKYETLIRIEDASRIISPFIFLDISKKIKYYNQLTKTIIEKSFELFHNRNEEFSINLSFEDIINNDTKEFLFNKIDQYNVNEKLFIEILETEDIDDFNIVKDFIKKIRSKGVKIAIDDFGSGYSNFAYLLEIEPDIIKIDGSIIKNIHKDKKAYKMAQTIISFAKKLKAKTVAEFVHNKEVYNKAHKLGIDFFQGYYLGEPKRL